MSKKKDKYSANVQPIPNAPRTSSKVEPLPNLPRDFKLEIEPMEKKAKYNSKLMSPKGDMGVYSEGELKRAFSRKIKNSGTAPICSKALPYHGAGSMEKDRGM